METLLIRPIDRIGIPEQDMWCKTNSNCLRTLPYIPIVKEVDPVTGETNSLPIVRQVDQTEAPTVEPIAQEAKLPIAAILALGAAFYFLVK